MTEQTKQNEADNAAADRNNEAALKAQAPKTQAVDDAVKAEAARTAAAKATPPATTQVAPATPPKVEDHSKDNKPAPEVHVNDPNSPEAIKEQHAKVDGELAKRNEENLEGHEKNMEKIEAAAHEAKMRGEHSDNHLAAHVPTGKENNRNTPRVLPDGSKVWD